MLLNTLKSASTWISFSKCLIYTAAFCLVVGLLQMFSREITIDSVRNIDFKLIQDFSAGYDFEKDEDRQKFKRAIDNLSGYTGKAFYPIALIGNDDCIENGDLAYLCRQYPNLQAVEAAIALGESTTSYGTTVIKTDDANYYYIGRASGHDEWLIGEAGKYLAFPADSWMRELAFLKNADYYLTDKRGLRKLWQKNQWIWLVSFVIALFLWGTNFLYHLKKQKEIDGLYREKDKAESDASDKSNAVNQLEFQRNSQNDRILILEEQEQEYKEELEQIRSERTKTERDLSQAMDEWRSAEEDKKMLDAKLSNMRNKLDASAKTKDSEKLSDELNSLKSLWQIDPSWYERYNVEHIVATNSEERTPFTAFVAFSGMERFLKAACNRNRIDARDDNQDRVAKLFEAEKIFWDEKKFLKKAMRARNAWVHDGKHPNPTLLKELLKLLEKRNTKPWC